MRAIRTTLTLEPDIETKLRALARERGISFEAAVDQTLRRGLAVGRDDRRVFRVEARPLRLWPGLDLARALTLAVALEDAETIRKLESRK